MTPSTDPGDDSTVTHPDQPSWEQIVTDHSARVYRLAYRLTGNRHDAEDLTQEVFVRVFRSLHTYTPGTMEGWLHRITTNLFLDQARRKQRIRFDAAQRRGRRPPARARCPRPTPPSWTGCSTPTSRPRWPPWPRTSGPRSCCATSRASAMRRSPTSSGLKLGTVRSRIHRGRAQLRAALAHRAPRPGRTRFAGPRLGSGLAGQVR